MWTWKGPWRCGDVDEQRRLVRAVIDSDGGPKHGGRRRLYVEWQEESGCQKPAVDICCFVYQLAGTCIVFFICSLNGSAVYPQQRNHLKLPDSRRSQQLVKRSCFTAIRFMRNRMEGHRPADGSDLFLHHMFRLPVEEIKTNKVDYKNNKYLFTCTKYKNADKVGLHCFYTFDLFI